ncbi:hypothetical protein J6590_093809 [Homalodisca vitripennis]|nr:hypothetical protein J6590_093809 [Homalodisca vitripennis]
MESLSSVTGSEPLHSFPPPHSTFIFYIKENFTTASDQGFNRLLISMYAVLLGKNNKLIKGWLAATHMLALGGTGLGLIDWFFETVRDAVVYLGAKVSKSIPPHLQPDPGHLQHSVLPSVTVPNLNNGENYTVVDYFTIKLHQNLVIGEKVHVNRLKTSEAQLRYSTFCKLRPFWVVEPHVDDRNTVACKIHANIEYLAAALHKAGGLTLKKPIKIERKQKLQ